MGLKITSFRYVKLSGIFLPFIVWHNSSVKVKAGVDIRLKGRVNLGNRNKKAVVISLLPINIYFGNNSKISFGHSVSIGPGVNIIAKDNSNFSVGSNTYFTSDSHIEVVNSISIGKNCAISWGVTIIDDDHHQLISEENIKEKKVPFVNIGDKVWIGCNVTILKNTIIGNNCVVAAGSIVRGSFPDNSLIAGNPAKIVKQNIDWK